MDQPRLDGKVNRRRFLKTAAGTTAGAALAAWSLKRPAPAGAAVRSDRARAVEPNPKRGGVLKWAGPAEVPHFDVHQGSPRAVMCHLYNNLVRFNPALAHGYRIRMSDQVEVHASALLMWSVRSSPLRRGTVHL